MDSAAVEEGLKVGRETFGVSIRWKLDEVNQTGNPSFYDFMSDTAVITAKDFGVYTDRGVDGRSLARFCGAHESGHAAEARSFAKYGFSPWRISAPSVSVRVLGVPLPAGALQNYAGMTLTSIQDFAIDRTILGKAGLQDPLGTLAVDEAVEIAAQKIDDVSMLEGIINLPHYLARYSQCGLPAEDKKKVREAVERIVGSELWAKTSDLLEAREFADAESYISLATKYFNTFMNLPTRLIEVPRTDLGNLPAFWKLEKYRILQLRLT